MLLDENEVVTGNVEVVVRSPQTFELFSRGFASDCCEKEYIAGYR
jgi:hypothetical protein